MTIAVPAQGTTPATDGRVNAVHVPKELWLAAILAMALSYLFFSENGAVLTENWEFMHEAFHDGRHVFGVPCH